MLTDPAPFDLTFKFVGVPGKPPLVEVGVNVGVGVSVKVGVLVSLIVLVNV